MADNTPIINYVPPWIVADQKILAYKFYAWSVKWIHDPTVISDIGIVSGHDVRANLCTADDENYHIANMEVGESLIVCMEDFDDFGFWKILRMPDDTIIPDRRGWFTRLLHFVFRIFKVD